MNFSISVCTFFLREAEVSMSKGNEQFRWKTTLNKNKRHTCMTITRDIELKDRDQWNKLFEFPNCCVRETGRGQ